MSTHDEERPMLTTAELARLRQANLDGPCPECGSTDLHQTQRYTECNACGTVFDDSGRTWDSAGAYDQDAHEASSRKTASWTVGDNVTIGDRMYEIATVGDDYLVVGPVDTWPDGKRKVAKPAPGQPLTLTDYSPRKQAAASPMYLVKEFDSGGRSYADEPVYDFTDLAEAEAFLERKEQRDRDNGVYRPDRWRLLSVTPRTAAFDPTTWTLTRLMMALRGEVRMTPEQRQMVEAEYSRRMSPQQRAAVLTSDQLRTLALGETVVPGEVNTLRDDACPICGSNDYRGDTCNSCGFMRPPVIFHDPDVEKAKIEDLREPKTPVDLACDNCGAVYPANPSAKEEDPVATATAILRAAAIPPPPPLPGQGATTDAAPAPTDPTAAPSAVEEEPTPTPEPEKPAPTEVTPEQGALCPSCGKGTLLPKDEVNGVEQDEADGAVPEALDDPEAGEPVTTEQQPMGAPGDEVVPTDDAEVPPEGEEGQEPPAAGEEEGEEEPPAEEEDPEAEETEEQRKKRKAEDKRLAASLVRRLAQTRSASAPVSPARTGGEEVEAPRPRRLAGRSQKEMSMSTTPRFEDERRSERPAPRQPMDRQAARQPENPRQLLHQTAAKTEANARLLSAQAAQIAQADRALKVALAQNEVLRKTVLALSEGLGTEAALKATAGLRKAAEQGGSTNGDEVALTDESAAAPEARVDVEAPGSVSSEANDNVTPDATTDLENTQVTEDQGALNHLTDVTEEHTNTGDATGEVQVQPSAPATKEVSNPIEESGWKSASRASKTDDPASLRTWAAMNLAQVRKNAGVTDEETLVLAQRIEADETISVQAMEVEIEALNKVVEAKTASARPAPRNLVPRSASPAGGVPSLAATAGRGGEDEPGAPTVDLGDTLY